MVYSKSAALTLCCLVDLWCSHLHRLWITTLWCWLQGKNLSINKRHIINMLQHSEVHQIHFYSFGFPCFLPVVDICFFLTCTITIISVVNLFPQAWTVGQTKQKMEHTRVWQQHKAQGRQHQKGVPRLDQPPSSDPSDCTASATASRCQGWCSINLTAPSAPLREASFEAKNPAPFWCKCWLTTCWQVLMVTLAQNGAITCTSHLHQGGENEQAPTIQEAVFSSGGDLRVEKRSTIWCWC